MNHCPHITNYARSGANPPNVIETCCHCGATREVAMFELQVMGDYHGDKVGLQIQMKDNDEEPSFETECLPEREAAG